MAFNSSEKWSVALGAELAVGLAMRTHTEKADKVNELFSKSMSYGVDATTVSVKGGLGVGASPNSCSGERPRDPARQRTSMSSAELLSTGSSACSVSCATSTTQ